MADGERSVAADRRKRARQNGVVQPLLTGRLLVLFGCLFLNVLFSLLQFVISALRLYDCFVDCNRHLHN
jgi:hypothetical protein